MGIDIDSRQELEQLLRDAQKGLLAFDELRRRSALTEPGHGRGPRRALGFLRRLWRRLRDLGPVWDREGELWQTSLAVQRTLAGGVDRISGELPRLDEIVNRLDRVAFDVAHHRDLDADRARQFDDRLRALDGRAREALGLARLFRRELDLRAADRLLAPAGFAAALRELETMLPGLRECHAIDVSMQNVRDEDLVRVADEHFGARLSARGPSYRAPNDAWIHVDFTPWSGRPILAENAAARLGPGGLFVLLTGAPAESPGTHPALRLVASRLLQAPAAVALQALVWQHV